MVDHNELSSISYEMSMLVQSFQNNKVLLGHNHWRCECNAEITNMVSVTVSVYQMLNSSC